MTCLERRVAERGVRTEEVEEQEGGEEMTTVEKKKNFFSVCEWK